MKENTKNFDTLTMSEQNAVHAGNGPVNVTDTAPMVKDGSIT